MYCLKCGRQINTEQAFCQDCLLEMEKYPVEPGTVVQLPQRPSGTPYKKPPRRRSQPLEEQVAALTRRARILAALLVAVTIIAALLAVPAWRYFLRNRHRPGQNYTAIITTTAATEQTTQSTEAE